MEDVVGGSALLLVRSLEDLPTTPTTDLGVEDVVGGSALLPVRSLEDLSVSQGPAHQMDTHRGGQEHTHVVRP